MTPADQVEFVEKCFAAYGRWGAYIAWTGDLRKVGADPKGVLNWHKAPEHLSSPEFATGLSGRVAHRNVALVLRKSNMVAIDCDGEGAVEHLQSLVGAVPRTVTTRTARGFHLLYRAPKRCMVTKFEVTAEKASINQRGAWSWRRRAGEPTFPASRY